MSAPLQSENQLVKKSRHHFCSLKRIEEGQQHGRQLRYLMQELLGFVVYIDDRLQGDLHEKAIAMLRGDLAEIIQILPETVLKRLFSYPIRFWLNVDNGAGKKGCCCHGVDLPREYMPCKFHSVEIFNVNDFLEQAHVQPAQLLHEISHWLHHDRVHEEEKQEKQGAWKASAGQISSSGPVTDLTDTAIVYRMSNFRNACLNGSFVLDRPELESGKALDFRNLILVQKDQGSRPAQPRIVCRCTDRWSTKNSACPDRWHLEIDGRVFAYRLGTDFGMTVFGWHEWQFNGPNGGWLSTSGVAESLHFDGTLLVTGFGQDFLNGEYVAKRSLESCHFVHSESKSGRYWVKDLGGDVVLRFTNMFSHMSESEVPFDRWHLETRGGGCHAYLCDVNPTAKGAWKEATVSRTDQVILKAYRSSLPLYTGFCERIGRYASEPHYAATHHKEYFAECSEAYFSTERFRNDYFPYIHEELKAYDPVGYAMCEWFWGPRSGEHGLEARYLNELCPCKTDGSASLEKGEFLALVSKAASARRRQVLDLGNDTVRPTQKRCCGSRAPCFDFDKKYTEFWPKKHLCVLSWFSRSFLRR